MKGNQPLLSLVFGISFQLFKHFVKIHNKFIKQDHHQKGKIISPGLNIVLILCTSYAL
jgi:hypothetical protein